MTWAREIYRLVDPFLNPTPFHQVTRQGRRFLSLEVLQDVIIRTYGINSLQVIFANVYRYASLPGLMRGIAALTWRSCCMSTCVSLWFGSISVQADFEGSGQPSINVCSRIDGLQVCSILSYLSVWKAELPSLCLILWSLSMVSLWGSYSAPMTLTTIFWGP